MKKVSKAKAGFKFGNSKLSDLIPN
jgi:hypothetical protein